jgi:signal transduction histidine kinase
MFGRTKKEIRINSELTKDLWTVEVDTSQIKQMLLNLYVNAWQAMPDGGDIYIQTENVFIDERFNKPSTVRSGKYVKIFVKDTGSGMDAATHKRIFDPFFSTFPVVTALTGRPIIF